MGVHLRRVVLGLVRVDRDEATRLFFPFLSAIPLPKP
jgi:hypothetical protein